MSGWFIKEVFEEDKKRVCEWLAHKRSILVGQKIIFYSQVNMALFDISLLWVCVSTEHFNM